MDYPAPLIAYKRKRRYSDISSPLEERKSLVAPNENRPVINLCDYWDYLEGLGYEAVCSILLKVRRPIRRFSIFITENCNLGCGYCSLKKKVYTRSTAIG